VLAVAVAAAVSVAVPFVVVVFVQPKWMRRPFLSQISYVVD
jgi:hypothetical protein